MVVRQTIKREVLLTVVAPVIAGIVLGLGLELLVLRGILFPWGWRGPAFTATDDIGLAAGAAGLLPLGCLQFLRSFRFRLGVLGSTAWALAFSTPGSVDNMYRYASPISGLDLSLFVFFFTPLAMLAVCWTGIVYGIRRLIYGKIVLWNDTMCPHCGYLVCGNASDRCPECGERTGPNQKSRRVRLS